MRRVARSFFHTWICATPMRRIVATCVWAGAVAGCSIDPLNNDLLTASIAPGTPRKSVCVIAAIGDTFSLQKVGVTAFGNALDIAGFRLAGGQDISVMRSWSRGGPRERAFLQAVFAGACAEF